MQPSPITIRHTACPPLGTIVWPSDSNSSLRGKTLDALVRVASGARSDWGALDDQERLIRQAAEAQGFAIGEVFREAGVSGSGRCPRPLLKQALRRVGTDASDGIAVSRLDRLGRNYRCVTDILNTLTALGGLLVTVEDHPA